MPSSRPQSRSVDTIHGSIDYDTVVCDSCGDEPVREDARRFIVGEQRERRERPTSGYTRYEFELETLGEGWICPYCREADGAPAGFPAVHPPTLRERVDRLDFWWIVAIFVFLWVCILLIPVLFG